MDYTVSGIFRNLKINSRFKFWTIVLILVLVVFSVISFFYYLKRNSSPRITVWAWERPENLLFIENRDVAVAFYAGNITFSNSETNFRPRLQPLVVDPGVPLIAVIRIINKEGGNQLNDSQLLEAVDLIIKTCLQDNLSGCQLDFDVRSSEIDFYKKLILETRKHLPDSLSLSITTLASWCHTGSWVDDLSINEVIPMFYRLGIDEDLIRRDLVSESFMKAKNCQKSIGVSIDEPLPKKEYLENRRIYIFNPHPWTSDDFFNIIKKIKTKMSE